MAYSSNPITVERLLPYLEPLAAGHETIWRTQPRRARWFAYKVREALRIADDYPERFPTLAGRRYRVEVVSHNEVRAVPLAVEVAEIIAGAPAPTVERVEASETFVSFDQIVDYWQKLQAEKVYLPNCALSNDDLLELWRWCQQAEVLLFENAGAITLLVREGNEDAAEFAWTPDDLDWERK